MNKLAKLGLALPLLAGGAVVGGNIRFKKMVEDEVRALFAASDQTETAVFPFLVIDHVYRGFAAHHPARLDFSPHPAKFRRGWQSRAGNSVGIFRKFRNQS
jgi:hypothetical protein